MDKVNPHARVKANVPLGTGNVNDHTTATKIFNAFHKGDKFVFSGDMVSKFNRFVINLDMMMQNWKEEHPGKPLDGIFAVLSKAKKNLSKTDCKTEFVDLRQYKG